MFQMGGGGTPGSSDGGGSGDVTAAANIANDAVVVGDGGAKGVRGRPSFTIATADLLQCVLDDIGTGEDRSILLVNTTDAALGAQQHSPMFAQQGEGWNGSAAEPVEVATQVIPVQGAEFPSSPAARWVLKESINGAAFDDLLTVESGGLVTLKGSLDTDGNRIILDADADSWMEESADDVIDVRIGSGGVVAQWTAEGLDLGGVGRVVFDADADTHMRGATDDEIAITVGGVAVGMFTAEGLDLDGVGRVVFDADTDTYIESSSDDVMNLHAGATHVQMGSLQIRPVGSCQNGAFNGRWSQLHTNGRQTVGVASVSDDYTVSASADFLVRISGQGVGKTLTMPAASSLTDGWFVILANDDGTDSVTIDGDGADTIEGSNTKTLAAGARVMLIYIDATTNWIAVGFESGDL